MSSLEERFRKVSQEYRDQNKTPSTEHSIFSGDLIHQMLKYQAAIGPIRPTKPRTGFSNYFTTEKMAQILKQLSEGNQSF